MSFIHKSSRVLQSLYSRDENPPKALVSDKDSSVMSFIQEAQKYVLFWGYALLLNFIKMPKENESNFASSLNELYPGVFSAVGSFLKCNVCKSSAKNLWFKKEKKIRIELNFLSCQKCQTCCKHLFLACFCILLLACFILSAH